MGAPGSGSAPDDRQMLLARVDALDGGVVALRRRQLAEAQRAHHALGPEPMHELAGHRGPVALAALDALVPHRADALPQYAAGELWHKRLIRPRPGYPSRHAETEPSAHNGE